jgi:hypothetical protein
MTERNETKIVKKTMEITPELAQKWLERNDENQRSIRKDDVRKYAEHMKNGEWEQNGETIKFDTEGNLLDGQHRLLACIKAGVPFTTIVVTGISNAAKMTIDVGTPRTPRDVLRFGGYKDIGLPHVTTIAPFYWGGRTGMKEAYRLTPIKVAEIYKKSKPAIDFAAEVAPTARQQLRAVIARAYENNVDPEILKRFAHIIQNGTAEDGTITPEDISAIKVAKILDSQQRGVRSNAQSRKLYSQIEEGLRLFTERRTNVSRIRPSEVELYPITSDRTNNVLQFAGED